MLTAKQIMTDRLARVDPSTSVVKAIQEMLAQDSNELIVVDDLGHLLGTVPGSTLLAAAFDGQLRNDPISLHMMRRAVSIEAQAPLDLIIEQFVLHQISHLPVVEGGRLIGSVSRNDVLESVFGSKQPKASPSRVA